MSRFTNLDATGAVSAANATNGPLVLERTTAANDLMWQRDDLGRMDYADAEKAIAKLNTESFCGFSDWRLPTVEELFLLADRTRFDPAIDTDYFPNCRSDWYWTASPVASNPVCAWFVNFYGGGGYLGYRDDRYSVRAVRSAARASQ